MGYIYEVGDVVTLKKGHPCGSRDWEILRVGADFRLKCIGCGHQIMVPRKMVEKNKKNLTYYKTPYGQMLVGVNTKNMEISVDEDQIGVKVAYELDVNHEPMADCRINMSIVPRNSKGVSMQLDIR